MQPDPDAKGPTLVQVLWLYVFILGLVVSIALLAPR